MKTILVINDNSLESAHAAKFALFMGQKMHADVLLANCENITAKVFERTVHGAMFKNTGIITADHDLKADLTLLNSFLHGFRPMIREIDVSDFDEQTIAALIYKNNIWLIVKGFTEISINALQQKQINIDTILRRICCPVLFIPYQWSIKRIERLVYITDLRYCRKEIVRFMAELSAAYNAGMSVAHVCATELVDMDESYAQAVFKEDICNYTGYKKIYFNHIKEVDLTKTLDVMINGLHNDMLVLVNRRFHFKSIIGKQITNSLPDYITIPLLLFP
jgi:hypothetical protein